MRLADRAWLVLGFGVGVYEAYAAAHAPGELLSEGVDRYLQSHPRLTRIVIAALALHLANGVPDELDPVHWAFVGMRKLLGER